MKWKEVNFCVISTVHNPSFRSCIIYQIEVIIVPAEMTL